MDKLRGGCLSLKGMLSMAKCKWKPPKRILALALSVLLVAVSAPVVALGAYEVVDVDGAASLDASLRDASDEADRPTRIKLVASVDIAASMSLSLAEGKHAVLDLNGFKISADASSGNDESVIDVSGDFTIDDSGSSGLIEGSRTIVAVGNDGSLTLNGGVLSSSSKGAPTVALYGNSVDSEVSLILNRGSIISEHDDGVSVRCCESDGATAKARFLMNGGTVDANRYGVSLGDRGVFEMSGGKIIGAESGVSVRGHDSVAEIAGGAIGGELRGVDVQGGSSLLLSGSPVISAPIGIFLNENALIGFSGPLTVADSISVDVEVDPITGPVTITRGLKGNASVADFKGVAEQREVIPDGDEAALAVGARAVFNGNDDDFDLYAQGEGSSAKLTFDLAGGTLNGKTGKIVIDVDMGETIDIFAAPEREGYTFEYWKGSEYYPGDKYTVEGDHTFTAMWKKVPKPPARNHVVAFEANGDGKAPEKQIVSEGEAATKPADPVADGWSFGGWCIDKEGKREYDFSSPVTSDIKLYAKWTRNPAPTTAPIIGTGDPIAGLVLSSLGLLATVLLLMASKALASRRRRREAAVRLSKSG